MVRVAGLLLLSTLSLLAVDCHERHGIRDDHASVAESEVSADAAEQIHISFGRSTSEIVVVWSSRNSSKTSSVQYGSSSSSSSSPLTESLNVSVAAECWQFTEGNPDGIQWLYRARLQVGYYPETTIMLQVIPRVHTSNPPQSVQRQIQLCIVARVHMYS